MNKKRILYIEYNTDGTIGGSHFSLLYLIEGLNKMNYYPIVVFYQENQLIQRFREAGSKIIILNKSKTINIHDLFPQIKHLSNCLIFKILALVPLTVLQKIINYFISFILPSFKCWKILRREKIDLVHLNNTILRPQQWILASLFTKAKVVAHERGINNQFPFQTRYWTRYLKAIICISDAVKINLIKFNFNQDKLTRIYNSLDPDKFMVTKNKENTLKEFNIDKNHPVVGIVGNIKQWKGQETVIRSIKNVRKQFPNIKCMIIGGVSPYDKAYLSHLKKSVKSEKLDDCIIFTGQRNDVPSLINALNILIHASTEPEPFGRVILEGMALKKPVISTNIGACPEIVEDGETGLLLKPGDEECLGNAIISLLKEPEKAIEMGKAGRVRLEKYFHISDNVGKIEELYYKILY